MPRGPYSAPIATPTAVTTTVDLFHLTATADSPITLAGMELYSTTETGDANEKVLSIQLVRGVTGGTGGTGLTEVNYMDGGATAPTTVVLGLNTTVSTAGSVLAAFGWNVRIPFIWWPIPEFRPIIDSTQDPVVFRLTAAPADSVTLAGTVYWFEH